MYAEFGIAALACLFGGMLISYGGPEGLFKRVVYILLILAMLEIATMFFYIIREETSKYEPTDLALGIKEEQLW